MEGLTDFLSRGYGYGDGDGYGSGYGYGYGDGYGSGSGYGSGYGSGSGYGDGSGKDIKRINGMEVVSIDGVYTVAQRMSRGVLRGFAFGRGYRLVPCVVVRNGTTFAHGKDVWEAMISLREKIYNDMSEDERIEAFWQEHNRKDTYTVENFYRWHHILTGSCDMGRRQFFDQHNLTMNERHTVGWFIGLTQNAYGGDIIRRLKEAENADR